MNAHSKSLGGCAAVGCSHTTVKNFTVLGLATAFATAAIKAKGHPEEKAALTTALADIGREVLSQFVDQDNFFQALGASIDEDAKAKATVERIGFPGLTGNAQSDGRAIAQWLRGGDRQETELDRGESPVDQSLRSLLDAMCPEGCSH